MEWLSENWVWVVVGVAFVAMHIFGHGGHGGHGKSQEGERKARKDDEPAARGGGHQH